MDTWLVDSKGEPIHVGDLLYCKWGYQVIVCRNSELGYYGLLCEPGGRCESIPYSLGDGKDYTVTH